MVVIGCPTGLGLRVSDDATAWSSIHHRSITAGPSRNRSMPAYAQQNPTTLGHESAFAPEATVTRRRRGSCICRTTLR